MKIEIKSREVEQRSAKGFTFRTQYGMTDLNGETRRVPISLEGEQAPYELGVYTVGDGSFYFGEYGRLMLGRLELVRVQAVAAARSA